MEDTLVPTVDTTGRAGPEALAELRAAASRSPVAHDVVGSTFVFPYAQVERLATHPRLEGVGLTVFDLLGIEDGPLRRWYGSLMFTNEGDRHTRLRRLVSRAFTPRSAERLRERAAHHVATALDRLVADGHADLVETFGLIPMRVMCDLLGVAQDDAATFAAWADDLSPVFGFMDPAAQERAATAIGELLGFVDDVVECRRHAPGDDLISDLLAAEDEGDRLTHDELIDMVANLLVGGHDTTAGQIGCSLSVLLEHPGAMALVADDPSLAPFVVDETIRFCPSIGAIPRTTTEPVDVAGTVIDAGRLVLLAVAVANRDDAVWVEPDRFVADRFALPGAPRLLSFGSGAHYCLGASLARMTLQQTVLGVAPLDLEPVDDPADLEWRTVLGQSPTQLRVAIA